MAANGSQELKVQDNWIRQWRGHEELLRYFRNPDYKSQDRSTYEIIKEKLKTVLDDIELRHGQDPSKERKKEWRMDRMKLYCNLLLIALGAEGDESELWNTTEHWDEKALPKLEDPRSTFMSLLVHIHENDGIIFRYYAKKEHRVSWQSDWFFLVESLEKYRMHFVNPIVEMLKAWTEKDMVYCQHLLEEARKAFKKKVVQCATSWKYKARMYWLLALGMHAPLEQGQVYDFKSFDYKGPITRLVQELIMDEQAELLLHNEGDSLFHYSKKKFREKFDKVKKFRAKFGKVKKTPLKLGKLDFSSLLAYASAANKHALVESILKSKDVISVQSHEWDYKCEKSWEKSWAQALWNAAYKGHDRVVQELLKYSNLYSSKHYNTVEEAMMPPLHVAVLRGHTSVVVAFCSAECKSDFSCHEEDHMLHQTPLEVATNLKPGKDILQEHFVAKKKKIQSTLLAREEVKQAVEESYRQRELTVGSANAILVGAALIAGVTYAGWLQPPLGYHSYSDTESYMFVQGHMTIQLFAIFNSMSFFCAIAAIVAGMETACFIEDLEDTYITKTVKKLRSRLKRTTTLFIVSVVFVLVAFGSAGIAILPPIRFYQNKMYITIGVGGFFCMVFILRMLLFCISKRLYKTTLRMTTRMMQKCLPSRCFTAWNELVTCLTNCLDHEDN